MVAEVLKGLKTVSGVKLSFVFLPHVPVEAGEQSLEL
jgi:hypothetical protein